jgi:hypothetical protein
LLLDTAYENKGNVDTMIRIEISSNDSDEEKLFFEAIKKFLSENTTTYAVSENELRKEIWVDPQRDDLWRLKQNLDITEWP